MNRMLNRSGFVRGPFAICGFVRGPFAICGFFILLYITIASACMSHSDLWQCATEKAAYNQCLHATDIHRHVKQQALLLQPVLLGIEGERYAKLFGDCDLNGDSCIELHEAVREDCRRDCAWRTLFADIMECGH